MVLPSFCDLRRPSLYAKLEEERRRREESKERWGRRVRGGKWKRRMRRRKAQGPGLALSRYSSNGSYKDIKPIKCSFTLRHHLIILTANSHVSKLSHTESLCLDRRMWAENAVGSSVLNQFLPAVESQKQSQAAKCKGSPRPSIFLPLLGLIA